MELYDLPAMACLWPLLPAGSIARDDDRSDVPALAPDSPGSRQSEESSSSSSGSAAVVSLTGGFRDIEREYRVHPRILGSGHYSSVREGEEIATGRRRAVKSVRKSDPLVDLDDLAREIALLRRIRHPNVIRFVDVHEDVDWVHITTDLCEGGELFDRIVARSSDEGNQAVCFPDDEAKNVLRQILSALSYLHDRHVAHRDIKPENVMFASRDPGSPLKLIDFGLARRHVEGAEPRMRTLVGTPYYIAPEVLRRRYAKSCDLWSVGVTAYVMLCGYPPFNGADNEEVYASIRSGRYRFPSCDWSGTTKGARDLVRGLLQRDPRRRMTAKEALCDPWIAGGPSSERPRGTSAE